MLRDALGRGKGWTGAPGAFGGTELPSRAKELIDVSRKVLFNVIIQ